MSQHRKHRRDIEARAPRDFDERKWPIYVSLVLFVSYFATSSYYILDWNHEDWYFNSKTYLILAPILLVTGFLLIKLSDRTAVRRGVQLSIILSLILHLSMFLGMIALEMIDVPRAPIDPSQREVAIREPVVTPDYNPAQINPSEYPKQDFEKPVETESAKPDMEEVPREKIQPDEPDLKPLPTAETEVSSKLTPNTPTKVELRPQVPKETLQNLPSKLSRSASESQQQKIEQIDRPKVERQPDPTPPKLTASQSNLNRKETQAETNRQQTEAPSETRSTTQLDRRELQKPAPNINASNANQINRQSVQRETRPLHAEKISATRTADKKVEVQSQALNTNRRQTLPTTQANQSNVADTTQASIQSSQALNRTQANAALPTLDPQSNPTNRPNRTIRSANLDYTPRQIDSPAVNRSQTPTERPQAEPARVAFSKSTSGIAGVGQAANLDVNSPSDAASTAPVASTSSARANTSTADGTRQINPSSSAQVLRSQADRSLPSATLLAQQVPNATQAGAQTLQDIQASSSSSLNQARSNNSPLGSVAQAQGTGDIDFGSNQTVGQATGNRASGGGQPELNPDVSSTASTLSRSGGSPQIGILATNVAAIPASQPGDGGGTAMSSDANQNNANSGFQITRRTNNNSGTSNLGNPTNLADIGSEGSTTGSAERVAMAPGLQRGTLGDQSRNNDLSGSSPAASISRSRGPLVPLGSITKADVSGTIPAPTSQKPGTSKLPAGQGLKLSRRPGSGTDITVNVDAPEGSGGLATNITPGVGMINRERKDNIPQLAMSTSRFPIKSALPGIPQLNIKAAIPTPAFDRRARKQGTDLGGGRGRPSPKTEAAIERGLLFLSRHQMPNGSWSLQHFGTTQPRFATAYANESSRLNSDTAATGLALLSFLGANYHHLDDKYQNHVRKGLQFLLDNQKANGDLYIPMDAITNSSAWLYSHGIASIALCEAYGMTQDSDLREPAQRALNFIAEAQDKQRGGWRYTPGSHSDTSVSGWMMMALKSGQLAGLNVPDKVFQRINTWISSASYNRGGKTLYVYNPDSPDTIQQRHGRLPSTTMTSVGLLMQLYAGHDREEKIMRDGAEHLLGNLPAIGTTGYPLRDTYYWYYATQVMFHMRGEYWEAWDNKLRPLLIDSQVQAGPLTGSWDPLTPVPDRWGPFAGRIYLTTMNILSLEVHYRHLPLYKDTNRLPE